MQTYEVEIKSLLGNEARAEEVRAALRKADAACTLVSKNKQLNHYFKDGALPELSDAIEEHISNGAQTKLKDLASRAKSFSVRTRDKDGEVLLVVKASVGDDTSENGVARIEFEEPVMLTLKQLDSIVISAGFMYQAKWSREREEYICRGVNVTLDKNAGYGWLAEFERVVNAESEVKDAQHQVRTLMRELGVEELKQDRLERMFAFYNSHWPQYYGTDKIFVVE